MADKYVINADPMMLSDYLSTIPKSLQPVYSTTRGVLIYQEQLMKLAQLMAGYSLGEADNMRRAIGK